MSKEFNPILMSDFDNMILRKKLDSEKARLSKKFTFDPEIGEKLLQDSEVIAMIEKSSSPDEPKNE